MVESVTVSDAPGSTVTWPSWAALTKQVTPLATVSFVGWVPVSVVVHAADGAAGVTALVAAEARPLPWAFVAVTVNV